MLFTYWINKDECEWRSTERRSTADPTRKVSIFARTAWKPFGTAATPREVYDVRHEKTGNPGPPKPVQAFGYATSTSKERGARSHYQEHVHGLWGEEVARRRERSRAEALRTEAEGVRRPWGKRVIGRWK
jgi:hypothetical protein